MFMKRNLKKHKNTTHIGHVKVLWNYFFPPKHFANRITCPCSPYKRCKLQKRSWGHLDRDCFGT